MDGASHLILFLLRIQNKNIYAFMFNVKLDFGLKSSLMLSLSGKFQRFLFPYPNRHGIQRPDEAFFHHNPKLLGLGRQIEQINLGHLRPIS